MATTKIILNLKKIKKNGEAPLYLRLTNNRKVNYMSIGLYIPPKNWDPDKQEIIGKIPDRDYLKAYVANKKAALLKSILTASEASEFVSNKKIKADFKGKGNTSFFTFANAFRDSAKKAGKISTYLKFKAVLTKLETFLKHKDIRFNDIDVAFLKAYEEHLRAGNPNPLNATRSKKKLGADGEILGYSNSTNTIHTNLKAIRRIFNQAVAEDLVSFEKNPFLRYKLKWENPVKSFLTEEELALVDNFPIDPVTKKFHHRNMYIFAAYSGGLRVSDVLQLKWEHFDGERIILKTQKTGSVISIKIPTRALEILNYYKTPESQPSDFIFPVLKNDLDYSDPTILRNTLSAANAYINKHLGEIKTSLGLNKPLNFHTSRHTFATRALKKGMRIEYVSKLMGHTSIKTTQVYAKIVNADLDQAMKDFDETLVKEAADRKLKVDEEAKKNKVKSSAKASKASQNKTNSKKTSKKA